MTRKVAYLNARLIDPTSGLDAPGGLLTEDGKIAGLGPRLFNAGIPEGAERIDCGGAVLAPGLIDMRVQLCEPGEEHKEDILSASRAAVAGGVTAIVALPDTHPPIDDVALVEFIARRAREAKLVKVFCHAAVTRGLAGLEITEIGLLQEAGALAFTDGRHAVASAAVMARALTYAQGFNALIMQHPEEPSLATGDMNAGEMATRLGLSGIRAEAELVMLERDLTLAAMTGGRYHAAHVSTAAAIARIRRAKAEGQPVTCDTAPHYFALNELAVGDWRTFAKVSPPLRSEEDRQAVVAGLADGTIDVIASDHSPQDQDSKRLPFAQAAPGIIGLETLLPLTLELVEQGKLTLIAALDRLTRRPAELLGLKLGKLAVGTPADLLLFDPGRAWQVDASRFRSKSKNTPFDGRPLQGRVLRTVVDGRSVFDADAASD
ncbi:MAG: dihydroorotase [Alphaproteobacteria bacterium]|nr:dihydroorotase [Alphaproteobacteria bacterium]